MNMTQNTDLTIFTNKNEDGIKLSDRLNVVLTNSKYFDVLVGYFRITGFYLLSEKLEDVEEIRLLIGLDTDDLTDRVYDLFEISGSNATEKVIKNVIDEFNSVKQQSEEMDQGIRRFCEWVHSGKLKIRMCYEKNVHAKVYIIRKDPEKMPDQFGNLITGSSNFTYSGLENNIEFNVELKNRKDVEYGLAFFEELWEQSKDITDEIVETIETKTFMRDDLTPYEVYLRALYIYFEEEMQSNNLDFEWPDGYMELRYQEDAIIQAKKILDKHGGVIISDVVGLGKTYIASMLGKKLEGRKLFIVPPVIKDNWEKTLEEFGYPKRDYVKSLGIIDQIANWNELNSFDYVFIDEAHRFRNSNSETFKNLKKICYNKKVILITATPQNNNILDIASLITLFQDSRNSSIIPDEKNLEDYFKRQESIMKASDYDPEVVSRVAEEIRDKVLRHVLIRRTRSEIVKYYKNDIKKQGISFPVVNDPIREDYAYDEEMDLAFNKTIELMSQLSYARYAPLLYLKDKSKIGKRRAPQENMKGFIKTLLVKRLESSIMAFEKSISRFKESSDAFIKLYESGKVIIGGSDTKYDPLDFINMEKYLFEDISQNHDIEILDSDEFTSNFIEEVLNDSHIFNEISSLWNKFDLETRDSKYDKLKEVINSLDDYKIIIFSEAQDTVDYLFRRLYKDYGDIVIGFSSKDTQSKKERIQQNFDPKSKNPKDDLRILVTTDALSEGINLHRAAIIINYDLPWNPTRVIQRLGRINRVGTQYTQLYVYNFFPRENVREHLSLEDAIRRKIQMFHELLGEDSKIITDDEKVDSYELYDFLMMANDIDSLEESSGSSQLPYLQELNKIRDEKPALYEKISGLPDNIRVARYGKINNNQMITFIKQGGILRFILYKDKESSEIRFEEAMELLKVKPNIKRAKMPDDYYNLLKYNLKVHRDLLNQKQVEAQKHNTSRNEKQLITYTKFLMKNDLSSEDKEFIHRVNRALENGKLDKMTVKQTSKAIKNVNTDNIIQVLRENIDEVYLTERRNYNVQSSLNHEEQIILSEYIVRRGK